MKRDGGISVTGMNWNGSVKYDATDNLEDNFFLTFVGQANERLRGTNVRKCIEQTRHLPPLYDSLFMADWKQLYQSALAETDPGKRLARIDEAERAIKNELRVLFEQGSSVGQRYELSDALRHLAVVRDAT
jgi:hypothetical protein